MGVVQHHRGVDQVALQSLPREQGEPVVEVLKPVDELAFDVEVILRERFLVRDSGVGLGEVTKATQLLVRDAARGQGLGDSVAAVHGALPAPRPRLGARSAVVSREGGRSGQSPRGTVRWVHVDRFRSRRRNSDEEHRFEVGRHCKFVQLGEILNTENKISIK